jgi:hypothetical protein
MNQVYHADSDTGLSNSDGITKNRSPKVTGVAMPGATVTLLANDASVGTAIVGVSGKWEIVSQELSDGNYDLNVEIKTQSGQVIKRTVKSITIDSAAPTLDVSGVFNGIDGLPSDQVKAQLTDRSSGLTNVAYQVDHQNPVNWNGNNGTWNQSASTLLNWNDSSQQGVHSLTIRAMDKAGNEAKQTMSFSVAKPMIWPDTDPWIDEVSPNQPNQPIQMNGLRGTAPSGSGISDTVEYGWGPDGRWGYYY